MSSSIMVIIQKLRDIEVSLGESCPAPIRLLLKEAQDHALQIQRESPEQLRRESRHQPMNSPAR